MNILTNIDFKDNVLELGWIASLALALILILIGSKIRNKFNFLKKYSIPGAIIGGFILMIITLILWLLFGKNDQNYAPIDIDNSIQSPLMIVFFTTVGLGMSKTIIKRGGKILVKFLFVAGSLAVIQGVIGLSIAFMFGEDPLLGLIAGPAALVGGHGTSAAWGPVIIDPINGGAGLKYGEAIGTLFGTAAATAGLIAGGVLGGPLASKLIRKNNLKPNEQISKKKAKKIMKNAIKQNDISESNDPLLTIFKMLGIVVISAAIGLLLVRVITEMQIAFGIVNPNDDAKAFLPLPSYIGGLVIAAIFRSINDRYKIVKLNFKIIDTISKLSLTLFLTYALMTLKIWQLAQGNLLPLLLVLMVVQFIMIILLAYYVYFKMLGKTYDSAVMLSGLIGAGLGATPVAIANMEATCDEYGYSRNSFIVVPIVCAFLIDLFMIPTLLIGLGLFK